MPYNDKMINIKHYMEEHMDKAIKINPKSVFSFLALFFALLTSICTFVFIKLHSSIKELNFNDLTWHMNPLNDFFYIGFLVFGILFLLAIIYTIYFNTRFIIVSAALLPAYLCICCIYSCVDIGSIFTLFCDLIFFETPFVGFFVILLMTLNGKIKARQLIIIISLVFAMFIFIYFSSILFSIAVCGASYFLTFAMFAFAIAKNPKEKAIN